MSVQIMPLGEKRPTYGLVGGGADNLFYMEKKNIGNDYLYLGLSTNQEDGPEE